MPPNKSLRCGGLQLSSSFKISLALHITSLNSTDFSSQIYEKISLWAEVTKSWTFRNSLSCSLMLIFRPPFSERANLIEPFRRRIWANPYDSNRGIIVSTGDSNINFLISPITHILTSNLIILFCIYNSITLVNCQYILLFIYNIFIILITFIER